jgi:predicted O-methyltransferase YrrM
MDQAVTAVLAEYDARARNEQELMRELAAGTGTRRLDDLLLHVGPKTGGLLNLLVKEAGAGSILEGGTSYGYSTVWLAEAARETGGKVVTLEVAGYKTEYARSRLAQAGLGDVVDFRVGDARTTLAALEGPFDFVLLDLWKDLYIACFDLFYPKLAPGATVVADNMLFPEMSLVAATAYRRHVRGTPGMSSVLLPVGSGIEVSRFRADP